MSENDVCRVIKNIDSSKAYQKDNIPPKILKENANVLSSFLKDDINLSFDKGKYPGNLKNADITPIFKKLNRNSKSNYRPVSILSTLSKIYEKLFINKCMNTLKTFSQSTCVVLEGDIVHNIVYYTCLKS